MGWSGSLLRRDELAVIMAAALILTIALPALAQPAPASRVTITIFPVYEGVRVEGMPFESKERADVGSTVLERWLSPVTVGSAAPLSPLIERFSSPLVSSSWAVECAYVCRRRALRFGRASNRRNRLIVLSSSVIPISFTLMKPSMCCPKKRWQTLPWQR